MRRMQGKWLQRNFPRSAGDVEDIAGQTQSGQTGPQTFHDPHTFPDIRPEMVRAPHRVALEQIVGTHGYLLKTVEQVPHRIEVVIDAFQEDRLV